jgi:hypothetical protein
VIGGVRGVTGEVPVGSWGLFRQFIGVLWTLIAVIGRLGERNGESYSTVK